VKAAHALGLGFLLALLVASPSVDARAPTVDQSCRFEGHQLWGKVKVVDSFPDVKVKVVDSFPDLKVKHVDAFPDDCGEWKLVDSFPDVKVQFVDSFPDVKIKFVDSFPGLP
jgi:hypothetical protein